MRSKVKYQPWPIQKQMFLVLFKILCSFSFAVPQGSFFLWQCLHGCPVVSCGNRYDLCRPRASRWPRRPWWVDGTRQRPGLHLWLRINTFGLSEQIHSARRHIQQADTLREDRYTHEQTDSASRYTQCVETFSRQTHSANRYTSLQAMRRGVFVGHVSVEEMKLISLKVCGNNGSESHVIILGGQIMNECFLNRGKKRLY